MFYCIAFSMAATLSCQYALEQGRLAGRSDAECQACGGPTEPQHGLSVLTRDQLELELQTLSQERNSLINQLRESTGSFQQQFKSLQDKRKCNSSVSLAFQEAPIRQQIW